MPTVNLMTDSNTYQRPVALPIGEVARQLGVTIGTVRNWERNGRIVSFRTPGGQRRFLVSELDRILTERAA